ncbi:MAG TPA: DUF1987 domain-containing protein [Bacteroides sp.]|nr:DUF1987 domain-containing protein [Bacteroides sp.]
MEPISIRETEATPSIEFNPEKGLLIIKGRSHPENAKIFYGPLIEWCESYAKDPPEKTVLRIQLEHFNTISSKSLLDVFRSLKEIQKTEKLILIDWYYESDDEELLDAGKTYEEITDIPFIMTPY